MQESKKESEQKPETLESYFEEKFKVVARRHNIVEPPEERRKGFRVNWSLQLKLMGINSLIMIITSTIIIGLATYFFKTDNEVNIKEENIKLVDLVGITVQNYMSSLILKSKQMAITLDTKLVNDKKVFTNLFFQLDPDIVYIGVYRIGQANLELSSSTVNEEFLAQNKMQEAFFKDLVTGSKSLLDRVSSGSIVLLNINQENQIIPFLAISIPYSKDLSGTKVIISILKLENIIASFEKRGVFQTFMVDLNGNVLAHPEKEKVLFVSNLISSPIVQEMLKSPLGNGQKRFLEDDKYYIGSFKKIDSISGGIISIVPENKIFEEVYNIQRRNIYISVISVFISLLVMFLFAKTISLPLISLLNATLKVSKGDFKVDIKTTTQDEVGLLTDHFIQMSKGLEEREKVKDALGRFVNPAVVKIVLENKLKLGGENKNCAIFFSDIRDFTAMSENLSPEEVVEFLNEYLTIMVNCVEMTFGVVDKFIGDAILATWGAVDTIGNPTENAINCAIMMRSELIRFNAKRAIQNKPPIKIGCGLNYGPVIAGQIGSMNRVEYTVIGDAVNLASRVETLTKPFGADILITEKMYEEVKDIYLVEKMKQIFVKGKKDSQTIYAVIARKDDTDPKTPKTLHDLRKFLGIEFEESKFASAGDTEEVKYTIIGDVEIN